MKASIVISLRLWRSLCASTPWHREHNEGILLQYRYTCIYTLGIYIYIYIYTYIFTGFASAADLFFRFFYDCLIDFNCFSIGFVALNRFSIDLHRFLEICMIFNFFCDFLRFSKMLRIF